MALTRARNHVFTGNGKEYSTLCSFAGLQYLPENLQDGVDDIRAQEFTGMAAQQLRFGPNQESLVGGPNILVDSVDIEFENDFINGANKGLHTAFAFTQFAIGVIAFGDESSQTQPRNRNNEHEDLQGDQPSETLRKNAKHKYRSDIQQQRGSSGSAYTSPYGNPNNRQEEQKEQLVGASEA